MQCKIPGCDREAMYKGKQVCQKHYFRFMRKGTYELTKKLAKYRVSNPAGYQKIYEPGHSLGTHNGYIYEHRKIVYDRYGPTLPPCELCGKEITWGSCHIDHIDRDVSNNNPENLRPLCSACNTRRDYPDQCSIKGRSSIEFDGVTKTAADWARDPRVFITGAQILYRKRKGMSDFDALFSPKKTHNRMMSDVIRA